MGNKNSKIDATNTIKKSNKKRTSTHKTSATSLPNSRRIPPTNRMVPKKPLAKPKVKTPVPVFKNGSLSVKEEEETSGARDEANSPIDDSKTSPPGSANWSKTIRTGTASESQTTPIESVVGEKKSATAESAVKALKNESESVPTLVAEVEPLEVDAPVVNNGSPSAPRIEVKEEFGTGDDQLDNRREEEDVLGHLRGRLELNFGGGSKDLLADLNVSIPTDPSVTTMSLFDNLSEELGDVNKFKFKDPVTPPSNQEVELKVANDEDEEDKKESISQMSTPNEKMDLSPKFKYSGENNEVRISSSLSEPSFSLPFSSNYYMDAAVKSSNLLLSLNNPLNKPKRVMVKSDLIALNHMPPVKYPARITQALELSDMWEIMGSVLVKHQGVRSLILEMSSPLHFKDLPLLTRWAQSKLNCDEVKASWASQAQVFELNALKKQSMRRARRHKPRIRKRAYKHNSPISPLKGEGKRVATLSPERRFSCGSLLRSQSTYLSPHQAHGGRPKSHSVHRRRRNRGHSHKRSTSRSDIILPIKCLFLDIEGVITPIDGPRLPRRYNELSKVLAEKLLVLKHIIYLTRCKLVLTSVARDRRFIDFINRILKAWGINPLYSVTHPLPKENGFVRLLPEKKRAREVEQWLFSRNVKSWCVIDTMDLSLLEKDGVERTVMVNGQVGLTSADGKLVVDILGFEPELYR